MPRLMRFCGIQRGVTGARRCRVLKTQAAHAPVKPGRFRPPTDCRAYRLQPRPNPRYWGLHGQVAEWSKAHAWKVCRRGTVSRVRIPLCPPPHNILCLNDFMWRALTRDFRGLQAGSPPRDLKMQTKLSPKMARASVWHLARYGFRTRLLALDLTLGHFKADRCPKSSKGLNSETGSSTKSKPPDNAVTDFRA